ncbi:hypothetical protein QBC32DRAFT_216173, partial [Pseudoneurospora amorphoporcata]
REHGASPLPTDHMAYGTYLIDGQQHTRENRTDRSIREAVDGTCVHRVLRSGTTSYSMANWSLTTMQLS